MPPRLGGPLGDFEPPDRCLIGRSRTCDLVLAARDISGEHAALHWSATHWELRDLGSRNGTFVGDVRLPPGGRAPLAVGAQLRFGRQSPPWVLLDGAAPRLFAVDVTRGERRFGDGGYLVLPSVDEPRAAIHRGPVGTWHIELDGHAHPVVDREIVDVDGPWRLHLPAAAEGTWEDGADHLLVAHLRLCFAFSRDEEYIEIVAWAGERRIDLQARVTHYPLLLLARRRLADQRAGLAEPDQGWIRQDDLLAMLKMKEDHLGVYFHRARAQLARAGVSDAAALIERRRGTRMLRLGVGTIELAPVDR